MTAANTTGNAPYYEGYLIGGLLKDPGKLPDADPLDTEDLIIPEYRSVLKVMRELAKLRGQLTTDDWPALVELVSELSNQPADNVAGQFRLLMEQVFSTANLRDTALRVKRLALERKQAEAADKKDFVQVAKWQAAIDALRAPSDADTAVKTWPILPEAALRGIAGDVVRLATQDCEADPAAILATFLTWFGVACGRPDGTTPYIAIGETRHSPRLFTALVGSSSRARKGTSKHPVQRLMVQAQSALGFMPCPQSDGPLSSGEGIIYQLRDGSDKRDKDGELVDPGSGDKRLVVIEGELGAVFKVMQREGSIVSTVLRVAWDGGVIDPITKNNKIRSTSPHLAIVGHITSDELKELLTQVDLRNGLANRFLWCMVRRTRLCSRPSPMPEGQAADLADAIRTAIQKAQDAGLIGWTGDALNAWDGLYTGLTEERPGGWGYATARAEAQVQRLALVYALLDSSTVITQDHLKAAHAFWRYCDASARYLFAESEGDPIGNKILEALRDAGGEMSQTELHGIFGRNLSAAKLTAALQLLQEHGRITQEQRPTGGRKSVVWKLLFTKKEERSKSDTEDNSSFFVNTRSQPNPDDLVKLLLNDGAGRSAAELRARLGWDEPTFNSIKADLMTVGRIEFKSGGWHLVEVRA
jgi:hypothetical protein